MGLLRRSSHYGIEGVEKLSHSRLLGIHHGEDDYVEIPSECEIRFLPCKMSYPPDIQPHSQELFIAYSNFSSISIPFTLRDNPGMRLPCSFWEV